MKIVMFIIALIFMFLFVGEFKISFNPFHIELPRWGLSVGFLLMGIGIHFIMGSMYLEGYQDALNKCKKELIELIKEEEE